MHWKQSFKKNPFRFFTAVGGLRDIAIGLMFILGNEAIHGLMLYQNYEALIPGVSGMLAGIAFFLVGIFALMTAACDTPLLARYALIFQTATWSFSGLMYIFNGDWFLALIFGFMNALLAGLTAKHYSYQLRWVKEKIALQQEIADLKAIIGTDLDRGG